jgi:hypothetical protein
MNGSKRLKKRFVTALLALLIALLAALAATFAWYIYNTNAHTTNVRMAAGAGASLQISNQGEDGFGSAIQLESFTGTLNPVSTDRISNGFQKVYGYTNGTENKSILMANLFKASEPQDFDYYKTTLYLRTNGETMQVYVASIDFDDSDEDNPISTAIRVGIVPRVNPDEEQDQEFIFAINTADNPQWAYNTEKGEDGTDYVLDSTQTDGSTVLFSALTEDNYCVYDRQTGSVSLKEDSIPLCTLSGTGDGDYGAVVAVDIYIWLEGCDKDCTQNLCATNLENLSISFAGLSL